MIQPLRTFHRRAFVALAFLLPSIVWTGLAVRRPVPRANAQAADRTAPSDGRLHVLSRSGALTADVSAHPSQPGLLQVVIGLRRELDEPDVLVYWADSVGELQDLPNRASFLSPLAPRLSVSLPAHAGLPGTLVLYSLAHRRVVDTIAIGNLP